MRMSNTKPMKNTMRKQSPMKMKSMGEQAKSAARDRLKEKIKEKAAANDGKEGITSKAELSAARKTAKDTSKKANAAAVKAVLEKNGASSKKPTGFGGMAKAALERKKAQKEVTATKRADTTKVEGPKPKPTGAAPKAATTKSTTSTTKTATTPVMMKKMGKSSCGK